MSRLDNYRSALLAANPSIDAFALEEKLDEGGAEFVSLVIDHGLGPLWHLRTKRDEFRKSRLAAEALYLAQQHALIDVDVALQEAGIEYALIKGAATRLLLYPNPAIRACHDLDVLVHPADRVTAATALQDCGFIAEPDANSISRELLLSRGEVNIDVHWSVLREGRLRRDPTAEMLGRRRRSNDTWMLCAEDALFILLVHPAFAKHLSAWDMGLHRVMDTSESLRAEDVDWTVVNALLTENGVRTAAWATLRWVQHLVGSDVRAGLQSVSSKLRPGWLKRTWIDIWLRRNLSARTSQVHSVRLLGFTALLHDSAGDAVRAWRGRNTARRRAAEDLAVFGFSGEQ